MTVANSSSIRVSASSLPTRPEADGKGAWKTLGSSGAKRRRWVALLAVSDRAPIVRPWKAPMNARKLGRPVA